MKTLIYAFTAVFVISSAAVAATPARKFSEKAFFKKIERIDPDKFDELWEYEFTVSLGNSKHTFVPDIRNGDIPLIKGDDSSIANAGQIIALLLKECMRKRVALVLASYVIGTTV